MGGPEIDGVLEKDLLEVALSGNAVVPRERLEDGRARGAPWAPLRSRTPPPMHRKASCAAH